MSKLETQVDEVGGTMYQPMVEVGVRVVMASGSGVVVERRGRGGGEAAARAMAAAAAGLAGWAYAGRALVPVRDSMRRQREFAADASHELRTEKPGGWEVNVFATIQEVDELLRL